MIIRLYSDDEDYIGYYHNVRVKDLYNEDFGSAVISWMLDQLKAENRRKNRKKRTLSITCTECRREYNSVDYSKCPVCEERKIQEFYQLIEGRD